MPLDSYLPQLLGVAGALLQYARQFRGVPEVAYHLVAVLLASGAYLLVHDFPVGKAEFAQYVIWLSGGVLTVWGGTFAASSAAKAAVGAGLNPQLKMVPLTNSK